MAEAAVVDESPLVASAAVVAMVTAVDKGTVATEAATLDDAAVVALAAVVAMVTVVA